MRSVLHTLLPLIEHGRVGSLILVDLPLILELGQFSSTLFVHFLLQIGSLLSIPLVHLLQDIHLMILTSGSLLSSSSLKFNLLSLNGRVKLLLFVFLQPLVLPLLLVPEQYVLLSGDVDILKEIDSGLFFTIPLGLSHLVLSLSLFIDKLLNLFLQSILVSFSLLIMFLEFDGLVSLGHSFSFLEVSHSLLSSKSSIEKFLISCLLNLQGNSSELLLGSIVVDKLNISLPVQDEFLPISFSVVLLLKFPLSLEHLLLLDFLFSLNVGDSPTLLSLPSKNVHSLRDLLLLLSLLSAFSFSLLLRIKHPEFGIDLLLLDGLLELGPLVHELLFSFKLATSDHELGLLLSQVISLHLKLSVVGLLNHLLTLGLSLLLDGVESFSHFASDLFRGLEVIHELLLVLLVFGGKKGC